MLYNNKQFVIKNHDDIKCIESLDLENIENVEVDVDVKDV